MDGKSPLAVLKGLGYNGDEAIALFPPIILDRISADLILSCDKEVGNELLAHYTKGVGMCPKVVEVIISPPSFAGGPPAC